METTPKTARGHDARVILSTLWMFAMFNYLYADVYTLFFDPVLRPESTKQLLSGYAGSIQITQSFVLLTAVLMETAIAMVLLSRVLNRGANRWANIVSGVFHTALVSWTLVDGTQNAFYIFFATIEIACTLFIVWYAWKWKSPQFSTQDMRLAGGESLVREGSK